MLKVKEMYSERMLARVWIAVARVATDRLEQFEAYNSAIDALGKSPWEAVDYRIEYAEWLFCRDFPVEDAQVRVWSRPPPLGHLPPLFSPVPSLSSPRCAPPPAL